MKIISFFVALKFLVIAFAFSANSSESFDSWLSSYKIYVLKNYTFI